MRSSMLYKFGIVWILSLTCVSILEESNKAHWRYSAYIFGILHFYNLEEKFIYQLSLIGYFYILHAGYNGQFKKLYEVLFILSILFVPPEVLLLPLSILNTLCWYRDSLDTFKTLVHVFVSAVISAVFCYSTIPILVWNPVYDIIILIYVLYVNILAEKFTIHRVEDPGYFSDYYDT